MNSEKLSIVLEIISFVFVTIDLLGLKRWEIIHSNIVRQFEKVQKFDPLFRLSQFTKKLIISKPVRLFVQAICICSVPFIWLLLKNKTSKIYAEYFLYFLIYSSFLLISLILFLIILSVLRYFLRVILEFIIKYLSNQATEGLLIGCGTILFFISKIILLWPERLNGFFN